MVAFRRIRSRHRIFHGESGNDLYYHRHPSGIADFQNRYALSVAIRGRGKRWEQPNGCITLPLNIIWIIFGGLWAWLMHIFFGVLLFITIIGIPFAKQHFKMARLSLAPFGKNVKLNF